MTTNLQGHANVNSETVPNVNSETVPNVNSETVPTVTLKAECIAVIIEPRQHPAFRLVVQNARRFIPPSWPIWVIHGTDNEEWSKEQSNGIENITFRSCGVANLTPYQYSHYMTTVEFWNQFPSNKILIFQTDSFLLRHGIKDFLKYDYVGAPWSRKHRRIYKVGNGGFSLRSKHTMLDAIQDQTYNGSRHPEDNFFSDYIYLHLARYKIPKYETAITFSVESAFHPNPIAIHKCWKHLRKHQWQLLVKKSPSLRVLKDMNTNSATRPVLKSALMPAHKPVLKSAHKPVLKSAHKPVLKSAHKPLPTFNYRRNISRNIPLRKKNYRRNTAQQNSHVLQKINPSNISKYSSDAGGLSQQYKHQYQPLSIMSGSMRHV